MLGNCQVQAISKILEYALKSIEDFRIEYILVYLDDIDEDNYSDFNRTLLEADWVFTQEVSDNYRQSNIFSTSRVKTLRSETVILPNFFLQVEHPMLGCLWDGSKTISPDSSEYCCLLMVSLYLMDLSIDEAANLYISQIPSLWKEFLKISLASLAEAQRREKNWFFQTSDLYLKNLGKRQIFNTYNHPKEWVLLLAAEKVIKFILSEEQNKMFAALNNLHSASSGCELTSLNQLSYRPLNSVMAANGLCQQVYQGQNYFRFGTNVMCEQNYIETWFNFFDNSFDREKIVNLLKSSSVNLDKIKSVTHALAAR